jgi:hypothetical protein
MGARVVTMIIAGVSAAIAAFSAWTARKSALTAREALAETRRNNQVAQAQRARDDSIKAFEDTVRLIESLGRDLPLAPQRVEPMRDALRSSAQAAGVVTPFIRELIVADAPLPQTRIDEVKTYLLGRIAYWEQEIERRKGLPLRGQIERGGA